MQFLRILLVLAMVPFVGMACMSAPKHGMDVKSAQGALGSYDSVHEYGSAGGRVVQQLTLNAQFNQGQAVHTEQDVLVQGAPSAPVPPKRPVYGRAAKAVRRTPPARPAPAPKVVTLKTTTTTTPGAETIASVGEGGPTTAHSVQANVPGAIGQVGSAAVGGHFFVQGMKALRPDRTEINQTNEGGNAWQKQGQGQESTNLNNNNNNNAATANSASSAASSAAAAAAAD